MSFVKSQQKMHLFCESQNDGQITSIEGKVEQECHLNPVLNDDYRHMLQQRTVEANRPRRTVQVVDSHAGNVQIGLVQHSREADLVKMYSRPRSGDGSQLDNRRERLPEAEVLNLIFKAFERYPLWTLKSITDYTHQPTSYVRDLLNRVAIYNTRGPNKNMYELRPEYKGGAGNQ
jgi:transcription initiation factor TFIIF subunit beta